MGRESMVLLKKKSHISTSRTFRSHIDRLYLAFNFKWSEIFLIVLNINDSADIWST